MIKSLARWLNRKEYKRIEDESEARRKDDARLIYLLNQLEERDTEIRDQYERAKAENVILRMVADVNPFFEVAQKISHHVEKFAPGVKCSILIYRNEKLWDFWSPSLSESYKALMQNGYPPGPGNGACGAAAHFKDYFFTEDIQTDENWLHFPVFQDEARAMGIKAVWSSAILDSKEQLLGTVALYADHKGPPDRRCMELLDWASRIAGIAIERHNTEQCLHEQNQMLRGMMDSQVELIVSFDLEKRVVYANKAYKKTFGITCEDIERGICLSDLVHPDSVEESKKHWKAILEDRRQVRFKQQARTVKGWRWFEWEGYPRLDQAGHLIGHGGSGRDITDRIDAECYRDALLHALPDLVFVLDEDGYYLDCYATQEEALAAPCEYIIGRHISDFLDQKTVEHSLLMLPRVLRTQIPDIQEYQLVVHGEIRYFEARVVPLTNDKLLAVVRDVTDWKKAQHNLARQLTAQQEALRWCLYAKDCPGSPDGSCSKTNGIEFDPQGFSEKNGTIREMA